MKKISILLLGLLLSTSVLYSQADFRAGYVIKSEGDTIFGELDYRGNHRMSEVCSFRKDKKDTITHYYPNDILAYRFIDSKFYVPKDVDGTKLFLEYLVNGKLNIYYRVDNFQTEHYYFEKDSIPLTELPYEEVIKWKDDKEYLYKSNRHIGILAYSLSDAKGLKTEIESIKKPDHKNLITLAKNYHNIVCDGEKCIIYEKKPFPFKIDIEACGGVIYIVDFDKPTMPLAGVVAHIWLPRISENLYFKTGLLGAMVENYGQKNIGLLIPFQFEYMYPHGIIRPKFAIGTNAPFMSLDFSPGINIKLLKSVYWSLNSDFRFSPSPSQERQLGVKLDFLSYSFSTGIYIRL